MATPGELTKGDRGTGEAAQILATFGGRFWLVAAVATVAALVLLGIPSAVIPNPWFIRMLPTEAVNVVVWLASAPLMGLLVATYLAPPASRRADPHARGEGRLSIASIGAYLAIGCPVCNKVIVAVLGVSGAIGVFAPLQPVIGGLSIALLAATLVWRLRKRAVECEACASRAPTTG